MDPKYGTLFEGWEIAIAKKLVNAQRKQWKCLELEGFDDLLQECLTHWFFVKDKYDPAREASEKTFMARVIKNKLADLTKEKERDKRKIHQKTVSLDEPVLPDEDSPTLAETLEDKNASIDVHLRACLKVDLSKAVQKLNPIQRQLCRLLGEEGLNMSQASERLKTPRSTLYEEIKRIRQIFESEDLRSYL